MSDTEQMDVDRIRYRMERIRQHLDDDVEGLLANAQQVLDWKYYVKRYPWASMAAVAAAGFTLVPRKSGPAHTVVLDDKATRKLNEINEKLSAAGGDQAKPTMIKSMVMLAASTLIRSGLNYLGQQIQQGNFRLRPDPTGDLQERGPSVPRS